MPTFDDPSSTNRKQFFSGVPSSETHNTLSVVADNATSLHSTSSADVVADVAILSARERCVRDITITKRPTSTPGGLGVKPRASYCICASVASLFMVARSSDSVARLPLYFTAVFLIIYFSLATLSQMSENRHLRNFPIRRGY